MTHTTLASALVAVCTAIAPAHADEPKSPRSQRCT